MLKDVVSTLRKSHDCSLEARLLVDRDAVDVVRSVLPLTLIVVWPSTLRDSLINWASLSVRLALLVLRRRRVVLGAAAFTALGLGLSTSFSSFSSSGFSGAATTLTRQSAYRALAGGWIVALA